MLCAVPALRALRHRYPRAQITLIGLSSCAWFVRRFGALLDSLVPFPGYPGIPEQPYSPRALSAFLDRTRAEPYDLAIQMHGSGILTNAFTALLGAREVAGFYRPGFFRPSAATFFPYVETGSEIRRCLHLAESLGCPAQGEALAFPVTDADREALRAHPLLGKLEPRRFVCVHPGARDPARRWPVERFACVADEVAARGYQVVLTGTAAERATADAVAARMTHAAVNAAGETSLGGTAALLERCALLVTNDTGVSHLAAALRTPSVVIFLASDPDRWAPLDRARHRPVLARSLASSAAAAMRTSWSDVPAAHETGQEALALLEAQERR
ncbi:MAG TPA: glycosyltransferase family 9 protein [Gammaproteobacteria bacterium]